METLASIIVLVTAVLYVSATRRIRNLFAYDDRHCGKINERAIKNIRRGNHKMYANSKQKGCSFKIYPLFDTELSIANKYCWEFVKFTIYCHNNQMISFLLQSQFNAICFWNLYAYENWILLYFRFCFISVCVAWRGRYVFCFGWLSSES